MKTAKAKVMMTALLLGSMLNAAYARGEFMKGDFIIQAAEKIAEATVHRRLWEGPTTGPVAQQHKTIVYLASDLRNGGVLGVSRGVSEATRVIGWTVRVLDGEGTVSGRSAAFRQAIALQPDGIIVGGFDAKEQAVGIQAANAQHIPVVGWHAAAKAGPVDDLFTNVASNAEDVAEITALYAVVKSKATAGVVIFTDSTYSVAIAKSDAMAQVIKACETCHLLAVEDTPLAETASRMPQLTSKLLQRYGAKWNYSLGINDLYFDFMAPTLAHAGAVGKNMQNLSAGDGSESAYQRIRDDRFQAGTVPEPLNLHGWQLVDELNRAFAGAPPSGYSSPVHLVTKENVGVDGGPRNIYDPDNSYRFHYIKIWNGK